MLFMYYGQALGDEKSAKLLCYKNVLKVLGAFEIDSMAPKIAGSGPVFFLAHPLHLPLASPEMSYVRAERRGLRVHHPAGCMGSGPRPDTFWPGCQ